MTEDICATGRRGARLEACAGSFGNPIGRTSRIGIAQKRSFGLLRAALEA
jgi:hypothetical protein